MKKISLGITAFYVATFVAFNVIGMIDLPIYYVSALGNGVGLLNSVAIASLVGGVLLAAMLGNRRLGVILPRAKVENRNYYHGKVARFAAYLSTVVAVAAVAESASRGVSVVSFDGRFETSGAVFLALYAAILLNIYFINVQLVESNRTSIGSKVCFFFLVALAIISGYRSPVIICVACYLIGLVSHRLRTGRGLNIKYKLVAVISVLSIVLFSSVYSLYRTSLVFDARSYYSEYDTSAIPDSLLFVMDPIATMHVDQVTISRLIDHVEFQGTMNGGLFASNFLTLLPGERLAARNIIGSITTNRVTESGRPWSITPTIQGALYTDFGVLGVAIGMLIIGYLVRRISRLFLSESPIRLTLASYLFVNLAMSIHNGYPDVIFYINIAALLGVYVLGSAVATKYGRMR